MTRLSAAYGRLLDALAVLAALMLLAMVILVTGRHPAAQLHAHGLRLGERSLRIRALPDDAADRAVAAAARPARAARSRARCVPPASPG